MVLWWHSVCGRSRCVNSHQRRVRRRRIGDETAKAESKSEPEEFPAGCAGSSEEPAFATHARRLAAVRSLGSWETAFWGLYVAGMAGFVTFLILRCAS